MNRTIEATAEEMARTILSQNTFSGDLTKTIAPDAHLSTQNPLKLVANLPSMSTQNQDGDQLRLEGVIGEGGMGLVQIAQQISLKRDVAVKSLKSSNTQLKYLYAMLQEAWVTGWLEHPNIVPVYTLGRTEDNRPLIVMKRIEGKAWQEIIHETDPQAQRSLTWHLSTLLDVCDAMEYAHTRGILHRDLKPENIMIGQFGEVYVLDWGIAVSLEDDLGGRFTLAADAMRSAGTPVYMTPEAALGTSAPDVRSDVYLLGGLLHELLTRTPPHQGDTLEAVLVAAARSLPHTYGPQVPSELAGICNTAMHADPQQRFEDVRAFSQAVRDYLEHKASIELSDQAHLALKQMRTELAADADPAGLITLYSECRFGFQQALRTWPQNPHARQGLLDCLRLKLGHDIQTASVHSAQEILSQLEQLGLTADELASFREQLSRAKRRQARLERVLHDQDLTVSARAKRWLTFALIVIWCGLPIAMDIMDFDRVVTYESYFYGGLRGVIAFALIGIFLRKAFSANAVNLRLVSTLSALTICMLASRIITWATQVPIQDALVLEVPSYALFLAFWAIHTDLRLLWVAALYFPAIALMIAFPAYDDWFLSATNALTMSTAVLTWTKPRVVKGPLDVTDTAG